MPLTPPKVLGVDVVAAQPTEADTAMFARVAARDEKSPPVAFIVRIRLEAPPPPVAMGWPLYVGEFRIPKYWEWRGGIWFKLFDPQFLRDHRGEPLRFSQNGTEFVETGVRLDTPALTDAPDALRASGLPLQSDVLK